MIAHLWIKYNGSDVFDKRKGPKGYRLKHKMFEENTRNVSLHDLNIRMAKEGKRKGEMKNK